MLKVKQKNGDVYLQMGIAYKALGDYVAASEVYERALRVEPTFVDALYNYGNVKLAMNDLDGALKLWSRVVELEPRQVSRFMHLVDNPTLPAEFRDLVRKVAADRPMNLGQTREIDRPDHRQSQMQPSHSDGAADQPHPPRPTPGEL